MKNKKNTKELNQEHFTAQLEYSIMLYYTIANKFNFNKEEAEHLRESITQTLWLNRKPNVIYLSIDNADNYDTFHKMISVSFSLLTNKLFLISKKKIQEYSIAIEADFAIRDAAKQLYEDVELLIQ